MELTDNKSSHWMDFFRWPGEWSKACWQSEAAFAGVPDYVHEAIVKAYVQTAAYKPIDNETLDRLFGHGQEPKEYRWNTSEI